MCDNINKADRITNKGRRDRADLPAIYSVEGTNTCHIHPKNQDVRPGSKSCRFSIGSPHTVHTAYCRGLARAHKIFQSGDHNEPISLLEHDLHLERLCLTKGDSWKGIDSLAGNQVVLHQRYPRL